MEGKEKKPIDFVNITKKLWPHRKKYFKVLPATLIGTYLLMVCIPRYYKCTVSLAPEASTGASITGSLGSLASSFGLGGSLAKMNSADAIFAEIYPNVISSKNFIAELMSTEVETKKGDVKCNYYVYLRDKQKAPWWGHLKSAVIDLFKKPTPDGHNGEEKLSVMNLTKKQDELFTAVQSNIKCVVDKKTEIVSITVQDQDPKVCAIMADATCQKLQDFISNYRTNKARIDYEYYEKLCDDSKAAYDSARAAYAAYADRHQNSVLVSYKSQEENLENDMQMKYTLYTTMNTQKQAAAAKLQEATPAFTIIESASVPIKPAGPKRMITAIAMTILVFLGLSGWLLLKEGRKRTDTQS